MQEKPSKACFHTTRGLDAADAVHSCFFSEGVFRGALMLFVFLLFYELIILRNGRKCNNGKISIFVQYGVKSVMKF